MIQATAPRQGEPPLSSFMSKPPRCRRPGELRGRVVERGRPHEPLAGRAHPHGLTIRVAGIDHDFTWAQIVQAAADGYGYTEAQVLAFINQSAESASPVADATGGASATPDLA